MSLFEKYNYNKSVKLDNFEKYVRGQKLARFIARYELFKKILNISGSIIECGVQYGGGLLAWGKLSNALEPYNQKRKIFGFDSFSGFPEVSEKDLIAFKNNSEIKIGGFGVEDFILDEIHESLEVFENNKTLKGDPKIEIIKGDAINTIPSFLEQHPEIIVSLLFLDFDLYEPTYVALDKFLPKMTKGSIIAFDEINDPKWPGETQAILKALELNKYKLQHFSIYPTLSFIVV